MKYNIILRTLTPLIISNRMNDALYKGVDFNKIEPEKDYKDANIVYQFPSYENRTLRNDEIFSHSKSYYIPASSIKGALCLEEKYRNIKFKDIKVEKDMITLSKLKKFQYLYQDEEYIVQKKEDANARPKAIKYTEYFPNIMVEMIKSESCVRGDMLLRGNDTVNCENIVNNIDEITRNKLNRYKKEIEKIRSMDYFKDLEDFNENIKETNFGKDTGMSKFKSIEKSIDNLLNQECIKIAFVGGFKGLIGGLNNCSFNEYKNIRSGFYIDEKTMLPYGLVELSINE